MIKFENLKDRIVITIPKEIIKFAAENHPEDPLEIKDLEQFSEKVLFELEHNLGSVESGHSGFEELLDEAMIEVATGGYDFVDFKEIEEF